MEEPSLIVQAIGLDKLQVEQVTIWLGGFKRPINQLWTYTNRIKMRLTGPTRKGSNWEERESLAEEVFRLLCSRAQKAIEVSLKGPWIRMVHAACKIALEQTGKGGSSSSSLDCSA
ncbi:hypothetical protein VNO77_33606 [Canavalia gladiata]|uniref:Uncharacterized protein n=1 Tax=Canavalia gladiata TaxID=3824 RepID=A0AAN9KDM9_CANGL